MIRLVNKIKPLSGKAKRVRRPMVKGLHWLSAAFFLCSLSLITVSCSGDQQGVEEGLDQGEGQQGQGDEYSEGGQQGEDGGNGAGEGYNNAAQGANDAGYNAAANAGAQAANAMQTQETVVEGESMNNATTDDYAMDMTAQTASPAIDQSLADGEPAAPPETATYMPGDIPAGWARTQNGLFINVTDLADNPLGYIEPPAVWH